MATTKQLYPLSTPAEQAIPLDVIRPTFLQSLDFIAGVSSPSISLPTGSSILFLRASAACVVQFGNGSASAVLPVSGAPALLDCLLLEADEVQVISLPISATALSVIGITFSGALYIQGVEAWKNLGLEVQQNRI